MWFKQGQIEVDGGDENDYGGDKCGDECGADDAEKISLPNPLPNPLHPSLHPLPNQSKPIVPTPSYSLS